MFVFVPQQQLKQMQTWSDHVSNVIKSFSTANGLLYINCMPIQETIIPRLKEIFNEMVTMVASQVIILSEEGVSKMELLAEVWLALVVDWLLQLVQYMISFLLFHCTFFVAAEALMVTLL